jgi:ribonuclease-3
MDESSLPQVEQIIGYKFSNPKLLVQAFTHSSAVTNRLESNERLEFLGDAVLGVVICRKLYEQFADFLEGDLTKAKSMLVSRRSCAKVAKQFGLIEFLQVGKGLFFGRALAGSISAGLCEALIAAVYIDGGFEEAESFVLRIFGEMIEQISSEQCHGNFKSLLQQFAQQNYNITPVYEVLDEQGPDHNKCFEVQAVVGGRRFISAWGTSKKEAEQKAAYNALIELGILQKHHHSD